MESVDLQGYLTFRLWVLSLLSYMYDPDGLLLLMHYVHHIIHPLSCSQRGVGQSSEKYLRSDTL
jgi:hypothetical protein